MPRHGFTYGKITSSPSTPRTTGGTPIRCASKSRYPGSTSNHSEKCFLMYSALSLNEAPWSRISVLELFDAAHGSTLPSLTTIGIGLCVAFVATTSHGNVIEAAVSSACSP